MARYLSPEGKVQSTRTAAPDAPQATKRTSAPAKAAVRTRGTDNPVIQQFAPAKAWEDLGTGEKIWNTAKEIPRALFGFLPPSIQEFEKDTTPPSPFKSMTRVAKGAFEFGKGAVEVSARAVGGAVLGVKQKITKKPERISINLPIVGMEIPSYQEQVRELTDQGFSPKESTALVAVNAYLGVLPFVAKGVKTKAGAKVVEAVKTKEVPTVATPEGIRQAIKGTPPEPGSVTKVERAPVKAVKEFLGKEPEQVKFNNILEDHLERFFEGRDAILNRENPVNQALLKLTDKELEHYSSVTQGLSVPTKISNNLKKAVQLWKDTSVKLENDLIQRGKLTIEQVENRKWKPIETVTGRTRGELQQMGVEPQYYPYMAEHLLKKSDFIPTTGKRTTGGYLKRFTGKMLAEDSYVKDPRVAIPRHQMQVFRDTMNAELVENIKTNFAETSKSVIRELENNPRLAQQMGLREWKPAGSLRFFPIEVPPTLLKPARKLVGVTKKVEKYFIPELVAKELDRVFKPGKIEKTLRMTYDPLIDMWRVSVLNLVPRWLYNNFVGNTVLYTLAHGDPAALLFKSPAELLSRTKAGAKLGMKPREIPKGVIQKEYAGGESPQVGKLGSLKTEQTQFLRPVENWLNLLEQAKNYPVLRGAANATQGMIKGWIAMGKPIGKLNKTVENWFRAALYISKTEGKFLGMQLDKPAAPLEGLKAVNEFLFDYTKLSRAERMTFRRALPFYNWMKNITEFSLKFPYNHPVKGLAAGAMIQNYVDFINEQAQASDEMKSVLRVKTDMTYEGKPLYLNVRSAVPFADVFNLMPTDFGLVKRILTGNPVSKIMIERGFKVNSFTGLPFTTPKEKIQYNEYGREILPVPGIRRHIGQQLPQTRIAEDVLDIARYGVPLKRFETGEPRLVRGQVQPLDMFMEVLRYFGISLSPIDFDKIKSNFEKKSRIQEVKEKQYEQRLKSQLLRRSKSK